MTHHLRIASHVGDSTILRVLFDQSVDFCVLDRRYFGLGAHLNFTKDRDLVEVDLRCFGLAADGSRAELNVGEDLLLSEIHHCGEALIGFNILRSDESRSMALLFKDEVVKMRMGKVSWVFLALLLFLLQLFLSSLPLLGRSGVILTRELNLLDVLAHLM